MTSRSLGGLFSRVNGSDALCVRLARIPRRTVHVSTTPQAEEQRRRRPLSPHLTIYQPQLTSLMSIGHRVTGAGLALAVYAFGCSYALLGGPETQLLVGWMAEAPAALVAGSKFLVAWPFWFHVMNGVRHLTWDLGRALSLRGTYATGWAVNILSFVAAAASAAVW